MPIEILKASKTEAQRKEDDAKVRSVVEDAFLLLKVRETKQSVLWQTNLMVAVQSFLNFLIVK